MKEKSKSNKICRQNRKNGRVWIFILAGILLLFLGVILVLLIIVGNATDDSATVEVPTVNVEKDIPETDMGDLVYHEPTTENVVIQGGLGYVNNEFLVTLNSAESLPSLKEYLAGIGGEVVGEIPLTADYQIMLSGTYSEEELETMIGQVKSLPYVERSSLNYAFELEDASNQYYPDDKKWDDWEATGGNNWNMKAIDAPGAWVYRNQMQSVNVGIIDGMFDPYHEDLNFEEMPLGNVADLGLFKYNNIGWWTSGQRHGTHVAGIIGATFDNKKGVCGVAPNAKLYGVDYQSESFRQKGDYLFRQKLALAYLVGEKHCRVINFSQCLPLHELMYSASRGQEDARKVLGGFNETLSAFIKELKEETGISFLFCKAADNDNNRLFFKKDNNDFINDYDYLDYIDYTENSNEERYKLYKGKITKKDCVSGGADAQYDIYSGILDKEIQDMIIVVGAARNGGSHSPFGKCKHSDYAISEYSDRGSRVDLIAPGGDQGDFNDSGIYSTVPDELGYANLSGTSMACPHVAGVAAMIFGIDPTFTAKEVKDIIVSTATGSYGSVKEQYPLLNARRAVEAAIKLRNEKAQGQTENDLLFAPSGEHQYKIFYDTLTWEEAKAACEAMGGHLATITSEEEQQELNSYNGGNHNLWIGGCKNADGQWCWVTGEPWEYENWGEGEPNNSSNVVADESCVAIWPEKWNDLANGNIYEQSGYVCEWETSGSESDAVDDGYTGHTYELYTLPESEWESGPITWEQAERRCEWKGGHLAIIESQAENDCLYNMMRQKGYENACFGYSDKETKGVWKWVNGAQSSYTNWHSGEPNNQNGDEDYAMFYQKFDDGKWNDGDGIIDIGCAYICEWDDPADKQLPSDSFTEQQLKIIAKDLGVPDNLNVCIKQYPKTYWEAAGLWDIYVEITLDGKIIASGSFDIENGKMGRNLYVYTPNS